MSFAFSAFTMKSFGLLGIFAMLLFAILFPMELIRLMSGLFSTFAFQIIGCLDTGDLFGIFTMNESGVRA